MTELFSLARLIFIASLEGFCSDVAETGEPCRGTTSSLGIIFGFVGSVRLYNDWYEVVIAVVTEEPLAIGVKYSVVVFGSFGTRVASTFC